MNARLRDYAVSASRGNALTALVIGWTIGKHVGSPWGIALVILLSTVYGFGVHLVLKDEELYEDWLGEFTESSRTRGDSR